MSTLVGTGQITIVDTNDGISAILSSEAATLPADVFGGISSYANGVTTMQVWLGGIDDSANWTFSKVDGPAITSSILGGTVSVISLSADSAYVAITASRVGYNPITKKFTVTRAKQGAPGATKQVKIVPSALGFKYTNGSPVPADQAIGLAVYGDLPAGSPVWESQSGVPYTIDTGKWAPWGVAFGLPSCGTGQSIAVNCADFGLIQQAVFKVTVGTLIDTYTIVRIDSGTQGIDGVSGSRGSSHFYVSGRTVWSDAVATAAAASGNGPIYMDVVTQYGTNFTETRYWDGASWITLAAVINGGLLIDGSVAASKIDTRSLTIKDGSGTTIFSSGTPLAGTYIADAAITNAKISGAISSTNFVTGSAGWSIDKAGTAEFNSGTFRGTLAVKSAATGQRTEITNSVIKVYDSGNVLRVQIGDLAA